MTAVLPARPIRFAAVAAAGSLVLAAAAAAAGDAPRCAPRAQVLELVEQQLQETRRAIGLAANDTVMELFASEARGTWSLVVTLPSGVSCLMAAGTAFEALPGPLPGLPA